MLFVSFNDDRVLLYGQCPVLYGRMQRIFVLGKKGSRTKKRMKEEEMGKDDCGPPTPKVNFFETLSDLNQAVPGAFHTGKVKVRKNLYENEV